MGRRRKTDPQLCVGYLRKSTDKQDLSFEAQRDGIERYALRHGLRVVAWHEDQLSGTTPHADRPGLQGALASLHDTRAGYLLVLRRDRLGRNDRGRPVVDDIEAAMDKLNVRALDTDVAPDAMGGDTDDDRCQTEDAGNARERRRIARRTREALAAKRARGQKTGGAVPYGFRVVEVLGTKTLQNPEGRVKALRPDIAEQATLRQIQALRAAGLTHKAIAAELDRFSYACRGARWHATTVARLLRADRTAA